MKTQKLVSHKEVDDNNSVFESCYYCSKELLQIEDIFVSADKDRYICGECSERMDIEVVSCMEY